MHLSTCIFKSPFAFPCLCPSTDGAPLFVLLNPTISLFGAAEMHGLKEAFYAAQLQSVSVTWISTTEAACQFLDQEKQGHGL